MSFKSHRLRSKNEATGIRVVSQYVQEFWECGWQPVEQRNDVGIDGYIIMRHKGKDLGAKVNVQVKCGASYISSTTKTHLRISIDDEPGLKQHIEYWRKQIEPAILVFVNGSKLCRDKTGEIIKDSKDKPIWVDSRLKAKAWWLNLKDEKIIADGTRTILEIPISQTFGEHSKGAITNLVKPLVDENSLQIVELNDRARKLYTAENITKDAKDFYLDWKSENSGKIYSPAFDQDVIISRMGWNHITHKRRGKERRLASFRLLGAAKQIIQEAKNPLLLTQEDDDPDFVIQKFGLRVKIRIKKEADRIVQVIILKRKKKSNKTVKYWFYSVHHRR